MQKYTSILEKDMDIKNYSDFTPMDETQWLDKEARIYRELTVAERVAWFRDLERCVQALAGEKACLSCDGEHDVAPLWQDPLAKISS
ncbi:MAG: hypothetical protein HY717_02005 [Planctomycetes bacterium]|nr:hypothetical protein [Planctomycetota bacterium]